MAKRKPYTHMTKDELETELARLEALYQQVRSKPYWRGQSFYEGQINRKINVIREVLRFRHPPPLPEISIQMRAWRGKRGLRVVVPLLTEAIGSEVQIRHVASIESGHLERVDSNLLDKIAAFLNTP